jgi:hypothetical protein
MTPCYFFVWLLNSIISIIATITIKIPIICKIIFVSFIYANLIKLIKPQNYF